MKGRLGNISSSKGYIVHNSQQIKPTDLKALSCWLLENKLLNQRAEHKSGKH